MTKRRGAGRPALDAGMSLIEVMVAMLVFAIISTGLVAGMVSITRTTGDNRAKIVAANLASQELDLVRAIGDPFKVTSKPKATVAVGGRDYQVLRTVSWVSQAGADVSCSSSSNLYFLRVNVRVTWSGQIGTRAVQDDTILSPAARTNDSTTGGIAVSVATADGTAVPGVSVSITAKSGGTGVTPTTPPAATGSDGCSYATKLAPGDYIVTISKSGWVDTTQTASPSQTKTVTAGATQSATFQYDQAATYSTTYAKNYAGAVQLPSSFETNFINASNGTFTTGAPASSVQLYPFTSGYSVVVGKSSSGTTTCASVDPQAWVGGTSNGVALGNGVRATATVGPGQSGPLAIPMGIVLVKAPANNYLGVTQATATGSGNPGCGLSGAVYTYTSTVTTGGTMAIAVPYGSWSVLYGTSTGNATAVSAANLSVPTNVAGGGVSASGVVTLDPRPAKP